MSLYPRTNQANTTPKLRAVLGTDQGVKISANTAYANVTPAAFINNQVIGVYGVNTAIAQSLHKGITPGWTVKVSGTGPVNTVSLGGGANPGGNNYSNTDLWKVSNGESNATGTVTTSNIGTITALTITGGGRGFINVATSVFAITNATGGSTSGTGANVIFTLGGRAGRVSYQTLAAFSGKGGGTTGNGSTLT